MALGIISFDTVSHIKQIRCMYYILSVVNHFQASCFLLLRPAGQTYWILGGRSVNIRRHTELTLADWIGGLAKETTTNIPDSSVICYLA